MFNDNLVLLCTKCLTEFSNFFIKLNVKHFIKFHVILDIDIFSSILLILFIVELVEISHVLTVIFRGIRLKQKEWL